ncbi:MAG: RNA 2',3'-cyclic phosphodiesterase [Acidimicrobiia bacterium]
MSPDDPMGRLFLGVALTHDARAAIAAHLGPMSPLPGRPAPPHNWHITLRFLGQTTTVQYERVLSGLDDLPLSLSLELGAFGTFPNPQRSNVLWLGLGAPSPELEAMAAAAEESAVAAGFSPEERPFHPHVTLSRLRPPHDLRALIDSVPHLRLRMAVDAMTVFRTRSESGGMRYEAIETLALG